MTSNRLSIGRHVIVLRRVGGAIIATVYDSTVIIGRLIDFGGDRDALIDHIKKTVLDEGGGQCLN